MKEIKGFTPKQTVSVRADKLPAGGYIAKILEAKVIEYTWGEVLCVNFDIADGEHKGHFMARFKADANSEFGQKWKGVFRVNVPSEKSKYPESDQQKLEHFIWAVQTSNKGYTWDWNEAGLKNKWIGVLFRNREWSFNGSTGWMTECCAVTSAQAIRAGDFEVPADKPLKKAQSQSAASAPASSASAPAQQEDGIIAFDGDEIPF